MGMLGGRPGRPGPGMLSPSVPKAGLALFWERFVRCFWDLVKLNLVFLLACLPVITIGPACAALSHLTTRMMREKPYFLWSDFWKAFRQNWKQGFATGLALAAAGGLIAVAGWFYGSMEGPARLLFFLVGAAALLLGLGAIYVFPMLSTFDLPLFAVYKNSLYLGVLCLKQSLPGLLVIAALTLGVVLYLPLTVPLLLLLHASLAGFVGSFAAWPGLERYVDRDARKGDAV